MKFTRQSLRHDLTRLGLGAGDLVMVHASVRAVGPVFGGPDEIHLAVEEAVSPGGTVMMVVGCPNVTDDVGRGIYTPEEEARILAHQPVFDPTTARANRDVGTLAEFFRSWPGTVCSDSSARVAARGARAGWLTHEHPLDYPFGKGTPYEKLVEARGKLLLLGSDHDEVTLMHYPEHVADFGDKIVVRYRMPVLRKGRREWVEVEEYDSSGGAHANWPERFFARIVDGFIAQHAGTERCAAGKVGDADSFLLDAAALVHFAIPVMERTARGLPHNGLVG